jgi:hypothetical protein
VVDRIENLIVRGATSTGSTVVASYLLVLHQTATELLVLELTVVLSEYSYHVIHVLRALVLQTAMVTVLDEVVIKHVGGLLGQLLNRLRGGTHPVTSVKVLGAFRLRKQALFLLRGPNLEA